jgi:CBS domain containing-hemolysin-like protein
MKSNTKWIITIFIISFVLSLLFSGVSTVMSTKFNNIVLVIITTIVVIIGIMFDMIGVAVLTSEEASLHAKASKKLQGAKAAISLLKNAPKVSSICQDVIGDICGIVSGSLAAVLTMNLANSLDLNLTLTSMLITAVVSTITVGFKAVSKTIATKNADEIVYNVGKIKEFFKIN